MGRELSLEEHQKIMFDILVDFVSFCDEHNLTYFLDAGTLLGAVRHHGFIPWDNDMDVCMLRPDFDIFCNLLKTTNNYLNNHLKLFTPLETNNPAYKLCDINTTLVEFPCKNPNIGHVYIDIFIKEGLKNLDKKEERLCEKIAFFGKMHWRTKLTFQNLAVYGHGIKRVLSFIFLKTIKDKNIFIKKQQRLIQKYTSKNPIDNCKYVTTLAHGEFDIACPIESFTSTDKCLFNGKFFTIPKGYAIWLSLLYGKDYMTPPPPEKQLVHNCKVFVEKPLISVVIPIYNKEKYLEKTISSLISQTYLNLEIILVDDGSTDKSSDIAKSFVSKDNRIHYFRKDNGGPSSARNFGLSLCRGDYVSFVDADDYLLEDTYERAISFAEKYSNSDKSIISITGKYNKDKIIKNDILLNYFVNGDVSLCTKIFSHSIIKKNFSFKETYCEDVLSCFSLFERCEEWLILKGQSYIINFSKDSRSRSCLNYDKEIQGISTTETVANEAKKYGKKVYGKAILHIIHAKFSALNKASMYGFDNEESKQNFKKKEKEYIKFIRKNILKAMFTCYFTYKEKIQIIFIAVSYRAFFYLKHYYSRRGDK